MSSSSEVLLTDVDNDRLETADLGDGTTVLRVISTDGGYASVRVPQSVVQALRLIRDNPDAVLADVRGLLDKCNLEDTNSNPAAHYVYTSEIRELLGRPVPCGNRQTFGDTAAFATCSRLKHNDSTPHVDTNLRLQWSLVTEDGAEFWDLRGWDGTDHDHQPDDEERYITGLVDQIVKELDGRGAASTLNVAGSKEFLAAYHVHIDAPNYVWDLVPERRAKDSALTATFGSLR